MEKKGVGVGEREGERGEGGWSEDLGWWGQEERNQDFEWGWGGGCYE